MSSMFCTKIYQCKNADWCARDYNPKSDCPECFEQLTNYDRIISKTPEELAEWLKNIRYSWTCLPRGNGNRCADFKDDCNACWLDWLRQEAEHGCAD